MNILVPANAMKYFEIIIPIVNYDLLINSKWYNDFLKNFMRKTTYGELEDAFDS